MLRKDNAFEQQVLVRGKDQEDKPASSRQPGAGVEQKSQQADSRAIKETMRGQPREGEIKGKRLD